jgi:hypothetical protein
MFFLRGGAGLSPSSSSESAHLLLLFRRFRWEIGDWVFGIEGEDDGFGLVQALGPPFLL